MNSCSVRRVLLFSFCFSLFAAPLSHGAAAPKKTLKVTTVAGGYVGNGGHATEASLYFPTWVATDSKGNLYISDSGNCEIRKVNRRGIITRFAGTGLCGYDGDGGPAKLAMIGSPSGILVDHAGNLLFADSGNSRIRQITPTGIITTIAGSGTLGYSGDGGPATQAALNYPTALCIDSIGSLYVADSGNYVLRKVDPTGTIQTIAGNHISGFGGDGGPATSAQMSYVNGLALDDSGNLYLADGGNARIRRIDATGTITTLVGQGTAGSAINFYSPQGLLLGPGALYVSAAANIWAVDLSSRNMSIVAGDPGGRSGFNEDGKSALTTLFVQPAGMAWDPDGGLLVADSRSFRIRKISTNQTVSTVAGGHIGDDGPAKQASLNTTYFSGHIAFDLAGNLYIADSYNNRVRKVSPDGIITTIAGTGETGYSGDGGPATAATLNAPYGVAADNNGNVYISDTNNAVIRKIDSAGMITSLSNPVNFRYIYGAGMTVDTAGNVYVAAIWNGTVFKITPAGVITAVAGGGGLLGGNGIPAGQVLLLDPTGVAIDKAGNLYIAELVGQRIRKVDTSGIMWTIAGNGTYGYSGDGGPAVAALLNSPLDVAVDTKGNVYVADNTNLRIRIIDTNGIINTFAGSGNGTDGNGLPALETLIVPSALATDPKGIIHFTDLLHNEVRKVH